MLITFQIARLSEHGRDRAPTFIAAVMAAATRVGETLQIDSAKWSELSRLHGVLGVPPAAFAARAVACDGCDWKRMTSERCFCDHPERACAILSPQRASETCPLNKWPAMPIDQPVSPARLARHQRHERRHAQIEEQGGRLDAMIARLEVTLSKLKARREVLKREIAAVSGHPIAR